LVGRAMSELVKRALRELEHQDVPRDNPAACHRAATTAVSRALAASALRAAVKTPAPPTADGAIAVPACCAALLADDDDVAVADTLVQRLSAWLAGSGKHELRKAKSGATALSAASHVALPFVDAASVRAVADALARREAVAPAKVLLTRDVRVEPSHRPLLLKHLRASLTAAREAADAELGDGNFRVVLPELSSTARRTQETQTWRLELSTTSAHSVAAARALDAASSALQPAVVRVPMELSAHHVVGRGGRFVRRLFSQLEQVAHSVAPSANLRAVVGIEVTSAALSAAVLMLPVKDTHRTAPVDWASAHSAAAAHLRPVLQSWLRLRTEAFHEGRVLAATRDSPQALEEIHVSPLAMSEFFKEQREGKRTNDARHKARRNTRPTGARRGCEPKRGKAGRSTPALHPRRSRQAPSCRRSSRAWALEELEQEDRDKGSLGWSAWCM